MSILSATRNGVIQARSTSYIAPGETDMTSNSNRLIMRFEQLVRQINRDIINPEIDVLTLDELRPVAELLARSRAAYLKRLFTIAKAHAKQDGLPSDEEMSEIRKLRQNYTELADASKALEVAIQREYLDLSVD